MLDKGFKSSFFSVIDNTLKFSWLAIVLIITNFAIISNKVKEFNLNININLFIMVGLILFMIITFIVFFVAWNITRIKLDDKMIIVYKNIFVKDRKEFLIKNIANIEISQNLFEKIFRLGRLKVYTNSMHKYTSDLEIIINKNKAFLFRNKIIKENNINTYDVESVDNNNEYDVRFKFTNILMHSFLSISVSSIIIILNFILLIFSMIQSGSLTKEIMYNFLGLIITFFAFIFPVIYSIVTNVIKYSNFKLKRTNDVIYISYGLFTTKKYIIPIEKINGLVIDIPFLAKVFGYYKIGIINAGIGGKKNKLAVLFPMCKRRESKEILDKILPEFKVNIRSKNQPADAFTVIFAKVLILMIVLIIPSIYFNIQVAGVVSLTMLLLIFIVYFVKKTVITNDYLCIENGIVIKHIVVIKYEKIEYFKVKEGPFSKNMGMCSMSIYILSDIKSIRHDTGYLKVDNFYMIAGKILNKAAT